MRKVSDLNLNINSQNIKIKWQDPELIDLAGVRKRAQGLCSPSGTGEAHDCYNGDAAYDNCFDGVGVD